MANELQTLVEQQRALFVRGAQDLAPVYTDENGEPCMEIVDANGEVSELPLFSMDYPISIVQPGSVQANKELAKHKGKFLINFGNDDNEFVEELWLLPITVINRGFTRYSGDFNSQQPSVRTCWSYNGLHHAADVATPYSARCANLKQGQFGPYLEVVCPEAKYVEGQRSACRQYINVAFFDVVHEVPLRYSMHGTGISAWNNLLKAYSRMKQNSRIKGKKTDISNYLLHITLEDCGTYYKPIFQFVQAPDEFADAAKKFKPAVHYYLTHNYNNPVDESRPDDAIVDKEDSEDEVIEMTF